MKSATNIVSNAKQMCSESGYQVTAFLIGYIYSCMKTYNPLHNMPIYGKVLQVLNTANSDTTLVINICNLRNNRTKHLHLYLSFHMLCNLYCYDFQVSLVNMGLEFGTHRGHT